MKTSNFKIYKGDMGVSICIYPPLDWTGAQYLPLAPNRQTFYAKKANEIDEKEYEKIYREETLSKLDPQKIYDRFFNNVLLCWEPPGEFCHRLIVSKWIFENLGIKVPEWQPGDEDPVNFQKPLF